MFHGIFGGNHDILEVENVRRAQNLIPELDLHSIDDLMKDLQMKMKGLVPKAGHFRSGDVFSILSCSVLVNR